MKNKEIKDLQLELRGLRIRKEKELKLAQSRAEINNLKTEIENLRKGERNPSQFKKNFKSGLKNFGRGLRLGFKGIQKASSNLQVNDSNLSKVVGKGKDYSRLSRNPRVSRKKPKTKTKSPRAWELP